LIVLEKFPDVKKLSPAEKLTLVSELWADLETNPSELSVSSETLFELDRRMEYFHQHPNQFTNWDTVKSKILGPLN
jgi:putative addiction module component (TIGR02574 family)